MLVGKINNTIFQGKKIPDKIVSKISMPTQKYNQYTEKQIEQIIKTAQEQKEITPKNEIELLIMMNKVGISNVLEYFKRHKI